MFFYKENTAVAAFGSIGNLTYTAVVPGTAGNNITVAHTVGNAATKGTNTFSVMTGTPPNIVFNSFVVRAKTAGATTIFINFMNGASNSASVSGNTITVTTAIAGQISLTNLRNALIAGASTLVDVDPIVGNGNAIYMNTNVNFAGTAAQPTAITSGSGNQNATYISVRLAATGATCAEVAALFVSAGTSVTATHSGDNAIAGIVTLSGGAD